MPDDTTKKLVKTGTKRVPARKRFTIPWADESTIEWWDAQDDPSVSLRMLIHDEIERHGYTDKVNRPVTQQPRKGRPPGDNMQSRPPLADQEQSPPQINNEQKTSSDETEVRHSPDGQRSTKTVIENSVPETSQSHSDEDGSDSDDYSDALSDLMG